MARLVSPGGGPVVEVSDEKAARLLRQGFTEADPAPKQAAKKAPAKKAAAKKSAKK